MIKIQDIFLKHYYDYEELYHVSINQHKVANAIMNCRTAHYGTHVLECNSDNCNHKEFSYNSCRNSYCPNCGTYKKEEWIHNQSQYLLDNTPYFHVVFTIPRELNSFALANPKDFYFCFFKAVSETLIEVSANKKYLGAKIGITSVLHTWGQNLSYHPHVHSIVTGGGLTDLNTWKTTSKDFFIPVKVLSKVFKGKLLYYLKKYKVFQSIATDEVDEKFEKSIETLIDNLYKKDWVVYCKKPFKNAWCVLEYLGRYTHKIAISNNRIKSLEDGVVTFIYRDYKDNNKTKEMGLEATEFIRRFLMHVLPNRFHKIRHYGLLASKNKAKRIKVCQKLTKTKEVLPIKTMTTEEKMALFFGEDYCTCPKCKKGKMMLVYDSIRPKDFVDSDKYEIAVKLNNV